MGNGETNTTVIIGKLLVAIGAVIVIAGLIIGGAGYILATIGAATIFGGYMMWDEGRKPDLE